MTLGSLKSNLIAAIAAKIVAGQTSDVNYDIYKKLKIDLKVVEELLNSIEKRIRAAEMIYHSWLQDVDHNLLSGKGNTLPITSNITFNFATNILKQTIDINDRELYRENVELKFREFVLLIATLYENIVRLLEILIKKIYLHLSTKAPQSTPFHDCVAFFKTLISLGYRSNDAVYNCVLKRDLFFRDYLLIINQLRNSYMHGFEANIGSDGTNCKVFLLRTPNGSNFIPASPELDIDTFSGITLSETKLFFNEIIDTITQSITISGTIIPC